MDEPKLPRLHKAVEELKAYIFTLTEQEKIIAGMKDFDCANYENISAPPHFRTLTTEEIVKVDIGSEQHCRNMIEGAKEDIAKYHKKEAGEGVASKIPKLLARYTKLPDLWRFYITKRLNPEFDIKEIGNSLGDIWIFSSFALIANEDEDDKTWDEESNEKMVTKFSSMIDQIEQNI